MKMTSKSLILFLIAVSFPFFHSIALQRVEGSRKVPSPTEEGTFQGTWYYVDRDQQFALFFKEEAEKIKAKLRWDLSSGESFETDWEGSCRYMYKGNEGTVRLEIANPENRNTLEGSWLWQFLYDSRERTEKATFKIYRVEKGFKLAWVMPDWEKIFRRGDKIKKMKFEQMHILRKASNRIIDWEEIDF